MDGKGAAAAALAALHSEGIQLRLQNAERFTDLLKALAKTGGKKKKKH